MSIRCNSSLCCAAAALAVMLILGGCTPGGQFDPTTIFNNDMFDSKTKLKGQREPLFPNGVPGATTGVPADLVKGYQPPPDQSDADADAQGAPAPAEAAKPEQRPQQKPEEKPKPKPKVAVGRPQTRPAAVEKPPSSTPTRIDIGAKGAPPQPPPTARHRHNRDNSPGRRRRRRPPPSKPRSRRNRSGRRRRRPRRRSLRLRHRPHQIRNRDSHSIRCGRNLPRAPHPLNRSEAWCRRTGRGGVPLCVDDLCELTRRCAWPALR